MMIDEFLKKFVEGYLFEDLKNMSKIKSRPSKRYGEAGYPMLMTTLAGMELLGALLYTKKPFDTNDGDKHFKNYWNNYLSIYEPKYKDMGRFFRQLVRNGLAHLFLAKPGIFIIKRCAKLHLARESNNSYVYIHATRFFKDFKNSYLKQVKPLLRKRDPSSISLKANMQSQLQEIIKVYSSHSNRLFGKEVKKLTPTNKIPTMISGASTSIVRFAQNFGTAPVN